jgi:hypothetical protein
MGQANRGEPEHAARLRVQIRAVQDRDITPGDAGALLAARPGWLITEQQRRQTQTKREAKDRPRRELADALVTSVDEARLQELNHAVSDADTAAINAQWAAEIRRVKQEARQLAGELTAEQVQARIGRERGASCDRAGHLLRRALGDSGG